MLQNQPEKEEMNGNTILKSAKVREIIQNKRRLVEVPHTASVADTLNALLANNILAVPVAAPPRQWIGAGGSMILESDKLTGSVRKQYIGMVSMLDILLHVAECVAGTDIEANLMSVPVSAIIGPSLEGLSLWSVNSDTSGIESDSWGCHAGEQKLGRCEKKQLPSSRIIATASEAQPAQWEEDSENSNEDFDISSSNFRYTDIGFHFRFFHHFHLPQLSSHDIDSTNLEDPMGPKASSCARPANYCCLCRLCLCRLIFEGDGHNFTRFPIFWFLGCLDPPGFLHQTALGAHTFINQYLCLTPSSTSIFVSVSASALSLHSRSCIVCIEIGSSFSVSASTYSFESA